MLGIGPFELILLFFVALIVLGPQKLPEIARAIGKGIIQFKRAMNSAMDDDEDVPGDTEREAEGDPSGKESYDPADNRPAPEAVPDPDPEVEAEAEEQHREESA